MLLSKVLAQIAFVLEVLATDLADFVIVDVNGFDMVIEHFFRREKLTTHIARQPIGEGGVVGLFDGVVESKTSISNCQTKKTIDSYRNEFNLSNAGCLT